MANLLHMVRKIICCLISFALEITIYSSRQQAVMLRSIGLGGIILKLT